MKIVICHNDSPKDVGGVSTWVQRIAPLWQAAGFEVIVHLLRHGSETGANEKALRAHGIACRSAEWPVSTDTAAQLLWKWAQLDQPAIYIPNAIVPAYYTAAHVKACGGVTLGVLHSDDSMYHGILGQFVNGPEEWRLSGVVSVSKFLDSLVVSSPLRMTIPCGVPLPSRTASRPADVFRIVYLGRLVNEQKQICSVADSLCRVASLNPQVQAWIIGDGAEREQVAEILHARSPEGRVKLLAPISSNEVFDVLAQCHALVLLSDYEGLPVCVMEAMAAGVVPVCLKMQSGIGELVKDHQTGLIVSDRAAGFDHAIATLSTDAALWEKLSVAARARIAADFSVTHTTSLWIDLLKKVAQHARFDAFTAARRKCTLPPCPSSLRQYDVRHGPIARLRHSQHRVRLGAFKQRVISQLRGLLAGA
ncbi:glycosyltransferase family 4 protein [Prosthecobacter sp.]|uniref:glycosyltransferase family 4 protein n=1 Tax=Prosthecobacter sp. TaxID=1965333 RepID=UPI003783798B